jgi:hypothetical protein
VGDQLGVVVVRERVVRLGHADLRIGARALLLAEHERDDAREIRLERQSCRSSISQVILEDRRRALRLLHLRQLDVDLFLGLAMRRSTSRTASVYCSILT